MREVAQLKLHFNLLHASHISVISEQQVIFDLISILRVIRGDRFLVIHVPLLQVFESLLIELSSKSVVYFKSIHWNESVTYFIRLSHARGGLQRGKKTK